MERVSNTIYKINTEIKNSCQETILLGFIFWPIRRTSYILGTLKLSTLVHLRSKKMFSQS